MFPAGNPRQTAIMPAFVIIPESTAEAGEGATGCAVGSHACNGNMPALQPKPIDIRKNTASIIFSLPLINDISSVPPGIKSVVTQYVFRKKKPIRPSPAPNME